MPSFCATRPISVASVYFLLVFASYFYKIAWYSRLSSRAGAATAVTAATAVMVMAMVMVMVMVMVRHHLLSFTVISNHLFKKEAGDCSRALHRNADSQQTQFYPVFYLREPVGLSCDYLKLFRI